MYLFSETLCEDGYKVWKSPLGVETTGSLWWSALFLCLHALYRQIYFLITDIGPELYPLQGYLIHITLHGFHGNLQQRGNI